MKIPNHIVGLVGATAIVGTISLPGMHPVHAQGVVEHSVGGGGDGEAAVPRGVWTFDMLSPEQRSLDSNCLNTALNPPGELPFSYGWMPSKKSFVLPRVELFDVVEFPGTEEDLAEVGGGVLRFDGPDFGFFPWHIGFIESPPFPAEQFSISTLFPEIVCHAANSGATHNDFYLTAGIRVIDPIEGPQFWWTLDVLHTFCIQGAHSQ